MSDSYLIESNIIVMSSFSLDELKGIPSKGTGATGTGIEKRFASQTAPAYSSKVTANVSAAHARAGRMPTTNNGGNITRRADQPTRRQPASAPLNKTAPPLPTIAVTGMGGLRAIKAGMHRQPGPAAMAAANKARR